MNAERPEIGRFNILHTSEGLLFDGMAQDGFEPFGRNAARVGKINIMVSAVKFQILLSGESLHLLDRFAFFIVRTDM